MQPYTDDDVLNLQDVIADARIRGIGNGTYSMARAILQAGYRPLPPVEHVNDIEATGRCCCAGCVGMGPCDLEPPRALGGGTYDEDVQP